MASIPGDRPSSSQTQIQDLSQVLKDAIDRLEAILPDEERVRLWEAGRVLDANAVMVFTAQLGAASRSREGRSIATHLHTVLLSVRNITIVLDTPLYSLAELMARVWGGIKVTTLMVSKYMSYFEQFSNIFMQLEGYFTRIGTLPQELLISSPRLQYAVFTFYASIIDCCKHFVEAIKRPWLRQVRVLFQNFNKKFEQDFISMKNHGDAMRQELDLASALSQQQQHTDFLNQLRAPYRSSKLPQMPQYTEIVNSISSYDHSMPFRRAARQRCPGTAEWIFVTEEFRKWIDEPFSSLLLCTGRVGSGKTVISAGVIQHLFTRINNKDRVVFLFLDSHDKALSNSEAILRSIIRQCLDPLPIYDGMASKLKYLESMHYKFQYLINLLSELIESTDKLYLILDDVEKCSEAERMQLLSGFARLCSSTKKLKIFLTTRSIKADVERLFPKRIVLSMASPHAKSDIAYFIGHDLTIRLQSGRLVVRDLRLLDRIKSSLAFTADGMFLPVVLLMDELCDQKSDNDILATLYNLPTNLIDVYGLALSRIKSTRLTHIAKSVFLWVSMAKRPLTVNELNEAMSVNIGDKSSNAEKRLGDISSLSTWCENLLYIDEEDETVRFSHHTVRDFLTSGNSKVFPEFHIDIGQADHYVGEICVTYLHFDALNKALPEPRAKDAPIVETPELHAQYPFLSYAAEHWVSHTNRFHEETSATWNLWCRMVKAGHPLAHTPWRNETFQDAQPDILSWAYRARHFALVQLIDDETNLIKETHAQSDISDLTYVSSVFANATDSTGRSSIPALANGHIQEAAKTLAFHLYMDSKLHGTYARGIKNIPSIKFSTNHSMLLKILMRDLKESPVNLFLRQLVRILATEESRTLVTSHIVKLFHLERQSSGPSQGFMDEIISEQEDRSYRLGLLLSSTRLDENNVQNQQQGEIDQGAREPENPDDYHYQDDYDDFEDEEDEAEEDEAEEDEAEEDPRYEGGIPEVQHSKLSKLVEVVQFFTTGPPYETFSSNLDCFIYPPATIAQALDKNNGRALRILLEKRFDKVAQGDYSWLWELKDLGHTAAEIAELLLEERRESPWINFELDPLEVPATEVQFQHHFKGCVHQIPPFSAKESISEEPRVTACGPGILSSTLRMIQGLCGLAGVTSATRGLGLWEDVARFEQNNSTASISYADIEESKITDRVQSCLEVLYRAMRHAQTSGLCCDSFTILLAKSADGSSYSDASHIEVHRVYLDTVKDILKDFTSLLHGGKLSGRSESAAISFLKTLFSTTLDQLGNSGESGRLAALHYFSLATQLICIGFQSYFQGHVGPFHPFFLDTPLKRFELYGCDLDQSLPHVEVNMERLTCFGDMLQGPVLVFRLSSPNSHSKDQDTSLAFDLKSKPADIVDTWGPGQFVFPAGRKLPSAIKIGGGFITASGTGEANHFHWSIDPDERTFDIGEIETETKMLIGASVSVNEDCVLDEEQFQAFNSGLLCPLGTYRPGWALDEKQIGGQAGQYVVLQANAAYHKYPGKTLKSHYLDQFHQLEEIDGELLMFLEEYWAVQVSLCTGVARRVPLREMVVDLLPVFAKGIFTPQKIKMWGNLVDHGILNSMPNDDFKAWLGALDEDLRRLAVSLILKILVSLKDTGLDRDKTSLLVSWPNGSDTTRCFKIDIKQRESSWARLIEDCHECATFAYATKKCLETDQIQCRGARFWRNTLPLLETAVAICSVSIPLDPFLTSTGILRHEGTYYFRKFESVIFVKALKPDGQVVAKLVDKSSGLRMSFLQRLRSKPPRLREQGISLETGETVNLLTAVRD